MVHCIGTNRVLVAYTYHNVKVRRILIKRDEDEEDNGSDDKKLRRGAASQGFLYFCLQLILCAKLSPEL